MHRTRRKRVGFEADRKESGAERDRRGAAGNRSVAAGVTASAPGVRRRRVLHPARPAPRGPSRRTDPLGADGRLPRPRTADPGPDVAHPVPLDRRDRRADRSVRHGADPVGPAALTAPADRLRGRDARDRRRGGPVAAAGARIRMGGRVDRDDPGPWVGGGGHRLPGAGNARRPHVHGRARARPECAGRDARGPRARPRGAPGRRPGGHHRLLRGRRRGGLGGAAATHLRARGRAEGGRGRGGGGERRDRRSEPRRQLLLVLHRLRRDRVRGRVSRARPRLPPDAVRAGRDRGPAASRRSSRPCCGAPSSCGPRT